MASAANTPVKCSTPARPKQPISMSKVRVVVRVRPFLPHEIEKENGSPVSCVSVLGHCCDPGQEVTVHLKDQYSSRNECYKLDSFFGQEDSKVGQIFHNEVCPLIPGIFYGCNASVFAHGATGSGKTYTMQGTEELPGLMPLAMSTILSMCHCTGSTAEISFYEVYMDRCFDLLEIKAHEILVLDGNDGQIHLRGLSRVPVNSMSEFHEAFSRAIQERKVAHTGLNDVSSRSHGVLMISVSTPCGDGSGSAVIGKLNLVDLAGNEDNRRTFNEGIRVQESSKINQSLFALSNVIYALNNNEPRIPYRESKLTRILKDSLGGNSHALMVACLNPGEYQESVHTVSLAARSRHIYNVSSVKEKDTRRVKVDMEEKLCAWLESKGKTKSAQRMGTVGSPFLSKTPRYVSSVKKSYKISSSTKIKVTSQGEPMVDKGEKMTDMRPALSNGSSPTIEKTKAVQSWTRDQVLSPIDANREPLEEDLLSRDHQRCEASFEPKTPKTPSVSTCDSNKFQSISTSREKFNVWSSNLKSSVVQEYIDFLNTASKEELLTIKGIGVKRAEYIIELREASPLKRISDMKKMGLSSKQIRRLFTAAVSGISK